MASFSSYDRRGYPTVSVQTGYGEWAASYEQTVEDEMDLALLESLTSVPWSQLDRAGLDPHIVDPQAARRPYAQLEADPLVLLWNRVLVLDALLGRLGIRPGSGCQHGPTQRVLAR